MSPEQVRGRDLDARTDLFSFGVVIYEMATGTLPFRGETSGLDHRRDSSPCAGAPVRLNPDLPAALEHIINRALEKDRKLRFQHAADMRAELQRVLRDRHVDSSERAPIPEADPTSPADGIACRYAPAASSDSASRTPAASKPISSSSKVKIERKEKEHEALKPIEKYLATFLGPMAGIIVQRTAAESQGYERDVCAARSEASVEKRSGRFPCAKR